MEDKAMQLLGRALLACALVFGGAALIAKGAGALNGALAASVPGHAAASSLALSKVGAVATEGLGVAVVGYGAKTAFGGK